MDAHSCPSCGVDLTKAGVREYGLVSFEIRLVYDRDWECFDMADGEEPRYGDCPSIQWACLRCGGDLGEFDPTDPWWEYSP